MSTLWRLQRFSILAFTASLAVICIERALYFLTAERLGFSDVANLCLALAFGACYVAGAQLSHRATAERHEKSVLQGVVALQCIVHVVLAFVPRPVPVFICACLAGFLYGAMWPIIESYVGAGHDAQDSQRAVGRFGLSWASAVPVTLILAGPLIRAWTPALFVLPAVLNIIMLALIRPIPPEPPRFAHDHPERLSVAEAENLGSLLGACRWLMLISYAVMFILAPLMPRVFQRLGVGVGAATALAAALDAMRFAAFAALFLWSGWHGRRYPVVLAALAMPAGFFLTLFGGRLEVVLLGEMLYGFAAGVVYYGALQYALVLHNAAVDAGGDHEGIIGLGFTAGPLIGLATVGLGPLLGSDILASAVVAGPLLLLCLFLSFRRLGGVRRNQGKAPLV